MTFILLAASILALMALMQVVCIRLDARRFLPPGQMLTGNCGRRHILVLGNGRPAVVLISGMAASCLTWGVVQPRLSERLATYSYDRSGVGWSDSDTGACS